MLLYYVYFVLIVWLCRYAAFINLFSYITAFSGWVTSTTGLCILPPASHVVLLTLQSRVQSRESSFTGFFSVWRGGDRTRDVSHPRRTLATTTSPRRILIFRSKQKYTTTMFLSIFLIENKNHARKNVICLLINYISG